MKAIDLGQEHIGHTISFTIRRKRHTFTLGHLYREDTRDHGPVILVRAADADPWDAYTLRPHTHVQVNP